MLKLDGISMEKIKVSEAVIDKNFRLLNNIRSRYNALIWQYEAFSHKDKGFVPKNEYYRDIALLRHLEYRLVNNSLIDKKEYLDIFQSRIVTGKLLHIAK